MTSLSLSGRVWTLRDVPSTDTDRLANTLQLHPVAARCLAGRVTDPELARTWMRPSLDHLHDPHQILGMDIAIERIRRAIEDDERIRIVTDYDVDGTTSSLILQGLLRLLGAGHRVDYHIPDRFNEGYGFSVTAAQQAAKDGIKLIITADIGVRDHAAVDEAKTHGVDVIICDHHLPSGASVPANATAVLCPPQEGCKYPNKALAACGVSLKLAQALLEDHQQRLPIIRSMLKIAAIGTVADVVDLSTTENRTIVAHGLQGLRHGPHIPGLRALLDVSGLHDQMTSQDLGFRLGPRINAAGRLSKATAIIELFDERDPHKARAHAQALDELNAKRQQIQRELVKKCLAQIPDPVPHFVTLWGDESDGWHRGVVGIVAAKVRDAVHRPTAIISISGKEARGSVRSIPTVHAVHALDSAQDVLLAHGGHPAAAGFSVDTVDIETLRKKLNDHAEQLADGEAWIPTIDVDALCDSAFMRMPDADLLAQSLSDLEPHGKGNPSPVIQIDNVQVSDLRPMGEKHIKMRIEGIEAIWWNGRIHSHTLTQGPVSLVGSLGYNVWRGRRTVRFTIEDARPATPQADAEPPLGP
ncbi:MAG: single-stranded-DNA-specific exonuclease RecJ [Deltaproteobacteria bacterium]|nr:single-stranded-DNA-specific exonuclease RecJ [Deltaproteobacteria bacterium]